jgi:glycosyltransferase involved in cell wall biosynthesis
MKKTICIISLSIISRDGRVLRQIEYLSRQYHIHVIGYGAPPQKYEVLPNITWHKLPIESFGFPLSITRSFARLVLAPFFPRLHPAFRIASQLRCNAYHANNWDALAFAAEAAKLNGSKLILDIHELYDTWFWGWITPVTKYVFRKYSSYVDFSTTLGEGIAETHRKFGLDPVIVMNTPDKADFKSSYRETENDRIRLIHHGAASSTRSSDLMIKVVAQSDLRYELHLMFINYEHKYVNSLMRLANELAPGRVIFHPPVAPFDIVREIAQYDVGLFPLPPSSYNDHVTALPNKLFEFIVAGLAVCIGPSPSMSAIVDQYHCGVIAPSFDPQEIANVLDTTSAEQWNEMRKASLRAAKVLNAENEMGKVLDLYRKLFQE